MLWSSTIWMANPDGIVFEEQEVNEAGLLVNEPKTKGVPLSPLLTPGQALQQGKRRINQYAMQFRLIQTSAPGDKGCQSRC